VFEVGGAFEGVGECGLVLGGFVGAGGCVGGGKLGDLGHGEGAVRPVGAFWGAALESTGVEAVDDGVAVAGLCAGEVESAVESAASVFVFGGEFAGFAGGSARAADASAEF